MKDGEMLQLEKNRRVFPRVPYDEVVEVFCQVAPLPPIPIADISEGGLRTKFLGVPTNTKVKVAFPLPRGAGKEMCIIDGEVVWRKLGTAGIRFINPPEKTSRLLHNFIRQQLVS
jgi:hypothetical protein